MNTKRIFRRILEGNFGELSKGTHEEILERTLVAFPEGTAGGTARGIFKATLERLEMRLFV